MGNVVRQKRTEIRASMSLMGLAVKIVDIASVGNVKLEGRRELSERPGRGNSKIKDGMMEQNAEGGEMNL